MDARQIMRTHPDNLMLTGTKFSTRTEVERAFVGSGYDVDPTCRIQYHDNGLLATFRAGTCTDEMEPWVALAWGTLRPDEQATWRLAWREMTREK